MRVLITGIRGFVGGHLAPLLEAAGHEVWGLTAPGEMPWAGGNATADLRDRPAVTRALQEIAPDAIVHLAAQSHVGPSWKNPELSFEINTLGTLHLLEACRALARPPLFLHVSTGEVYGQVRAEDLPLGEESPLRPVSPYAVSKTAADLLASQYHMSYGLPVIRVRPFNHEGPGRQPAFALSDWSRRLARISLGLDSPALSVGNLEVRRDFLDVRDVAAAYALLLQKGEPGGLYVCGRGEGYALKDLLEQLIALSGCAVEVKVDPARFRPADVPLLVANPAKLMATTGWAPKIPMAQTLRDMYEWWLTASRESGRAEPE